MNPQQKVSALAVLIGLIVVVALIQSSLGMELLTVADAGPDPASLILDSGPTPTDYSYLEFPTALPPTATLTIEQLIGTVEATTQARLLSPEAATAEAASAIYPASRLRTGFSLGGQVHDFLYPDKMHEARMTWVKFQIREGDTDAVEKIARGHAAGFRVLLSVLGTTERVIEADYQRQYATYVAALAAGGADAIEVWNESNVDRDWPLGEISPAAYLNLLRPSYQAIKASNPDTLVISSALASTMVANSLRSDGFWTEMDYSAAFVREGGLRYVDCVGVHFNASTVPPDTSDQNATWDAALLYFPRVLQYYKALTQSTRPLCFTELGYLTAEGYPALAETAPDFSWAAHTTLQNQADWLAAAAAIGQANDNVEMIIVWNVDFMEYGNDPHAGYAIVRPGGSCPACETLAAVMRP